MTPNQFTVFCRLFIFFTKALCLAIYSLRSHNAEAMSIKFYKESESELFDMKKYYNEADYD